MLQYEDMKNEGEQNILLNSIRPGFVEDDANLTQFYRNFLLQLCPRRGENLQLGF